MTLRFVSLLIAGVAVAGAGQAQTRAAPPPVTAAAPPASAPATPVPAAAPAAAMPAASFTPFTAPSPPVDAIATLTAAGKFTILLKAIDAAGLTATLKQPGNLTVFAPTDDAFAAVPAATLADLMKAENRTKLQHILLYHVINAPVTTTETAGHAAADIKSVAGPTLHVDGSSGMLKINDASVVQADVKTSNGEIQVIDKVLMPTS